jgi:hypothetical protein
VGEIHRDPYPGSFHPRWKKEEFFLFPRNVRLLPSLRIPAVFSFRLLVSPVFFFLFLFHGGSSLATLAVKFPSGGFKRAGIEREWNSTNGESSV